ncbi:MAG TPA: hypothetical protein VL588_01435, partial [Bdellovibrionota bacterium]|nr:hypothetical protein [Bdellovibrionota bacterium]
APTTPTPAPTDPAPTPATPGDGGTGTTPSTTGQVGDPNGQTGATGTGVGGSGGTDPTSTADHHDGDGGTNPNPNPNPNPTNPGDHNQPGDPNGQDGGSPNGQPGGNSDHNQQGDPNGLLGGSNDPDGKPLDCSTSGKQAMVALMQSGNYGIQMMGRSQYFACRVTESHAQDPSAVFMANAALTLSHAAATDSLQELRDFFPNGVAAIDVLLSQPGTPGTAELRDLRAFLVDMQSASDATLVGYSLNPAAFRARLQPHFCPWKAQVEAVDHGATLLFPRQIAECH